MVAGAAFGLALMLKPTLLLMAPVALLAGGHRRALIASSVTCACALALSIVVHGVGPWIAWLTVAPDYLARIAADPRYRTAIIAPTGLVIRLGATGWLLTICRIGLVVVGATLVAGVFRIRGASPALRVVALVGASLLATPYAMNYETALLAPAAAFAVIEAEGVRRLGLGLAVYVSLASAGLPNIGGFAFPIFLGLALWFFAPAAVMPIGRSPSVFRSR